MTALPGFGADIVASVETDLNNDGRVERISLLHTGDGGADLLIEHIRGARLIVPDFAWIGGIGQEPSLSVNASGSVLVTSQNESVGRNRWVQTLTIAYRSGAYRVAGYTYGYYDTLDLQATGSCDLNLLNAKGFVSVQNGAQQAIQHQLGAMPIAEWSMDTPIPEVCRLWE